METDQAEIERLAKQSAMEWIVESIDKEFGPPPHWNAKSAEAIAIRKKREEMKKRLKAQTCVEDADWGKGVETKLPGLIKAGKHVSRRYPLKGPDDTITSFGSDISGATLTIRTMRGRSVQRATQYMFLHILLLELIESEAKEDLKEVKKIFVRIIRDLKNLEGKKPVRGERCQTKTTTTEAASME